MLKTFNPLTPAGINVSKSITYDWTGRSVDSYAQEERKGILTYIGEGVVENNPLPVEKRDPNLTHFWKFT